MADIVISGEEMCIRDSNLFAFHDSPNSDCPIGGAIHEILDGELEAAQRALENRLRQTTLQDLLGRLPS